MRLSLFSLRFLTFAVPMIWFSMMIFLVHEEFNSIRKIRDSIELLTAKGYKIHHIPSSSIDNGFSRLKIKLSREVEIMERENSWEKSLKKNNNERNKGEFLFNSAKTASDFENISKSGQHHSTVFDNSKADDEMIITELVIDKNVDVIENFKLKSSSERDRLRHLESMAPEDAPGEWGRPVIIDKLSTEERILMEELYKKNSFNQFVSDKISVHRRLRDARNPSCQSKTYPKDLPDTSIIICFHNEAWSVLLRTIHSILDRSPPHLLKEIILVDDFSDMDHLGQTLDNYLTEPGLEKIKLVRTARREGLIRARLLGYSVAVGQVLTFLDSHIECFPGWLEPLLTRIAEDRTTIIAPVIDSISERTLSCSGRELHNLGKFNLNLMIFKWDTLPRNLLRKELSHPVQTPTIAGGLFSVSRGYFTELGTYDRNMDIWGGENLELSFRVWMCGGRLEIHPCSHVAHIFRQTSPYKWGRPFSEILRKNSVRVAEVWLDEYKHLYYEKINYKLGDYGDLSERKLLKQRLKCKNFTWYINNVYPRFKIPERALYTGEIRNKMSDICIDSMDDSNQDPTALPCHGLGMNQAFRYTIKRHIQFLSTREECFTYSPKRNTFHLMQCNEGYKSLKQEWIYTTDQHLRIKDMNICLELKSDNITLSGAPCKGKQSQRWTFSRKVQIEK